MGIIGGALLGIIVGIFLFIAKEKSRGSAKQIFVALNTVGPEAARAVVDKMFPANPSLPNMNRMAALALLGDAAALEREIPAHTGKPLYVAQVNALGLLGLMMCGPDPKGAWAKLQELGALAAKQSSMLTKILADNVKTIAAVGAALAGSAAPESIPAGNLPRVVMNQALVKLLLWDAIAKAFELRGEMEKAANARERVSLERQMRSATAT